MARRRYQHGSLIVRGREQKWVLRWREDVVGLDGSVKRIERKTVLGAKAEMPTRRLAQRAADLLLSRINRPDYRPSRSASFGEFVEQWKQKILPLLKPSTKASIESYLRCYLVPKLARFRLEELNQQETQNFVGELSGLSGKTVRSILGTLVSILNTAHRWGYTVSEVRRSDLVLPERNVQEARFFTAREVTNIILAADYPWRAVFAVAAMTGLRPGEVMGLAVDDIDFDANLIYVRRSAWYSHLQTPKSKKSLAPVPMPEPLVGILREYLMVCPPTNTQRLLFATKNGTPYSANHVVQRKLWPLLDKLKIPHCGMHAFRHTAASLFAATGASPKAAQAQLRHADPMTTLRYYTHLMGQEQRDAAEKVARILWPTKENVNAPARQQSSKDD